MKFIIILLGGILAVLGYKITKYTPKFETVKSTSGRTVKFLNYPEGKKLKRKKIFGRLLIFAGIILFSTGVLLEVFYKR